MGRFRALLVSWIPTIIFNVVLPYATYLVLTNRGVGIVPALAVSAVWPAVEVAVLYAIRRRIDEFGVLTIVLLAVGVLASLAFHSSRLALVKESALTGMFGVVLLGSLLLPRPLMFYFGRKFGTDGSAEGVAWWNGLWRYAGFRRTQRVLTAVWGVVLLSEALVRIALTYTLSARVMVPVNSIVPLVVIALLVFWTIAYAKRSRARAAEANPAAFAARA